MPPTERLWLTQPARLTKLASVTQVSGDRFTLDASLFCPKSHTYGHVQRPDRGTVWTGGGQKRKLVSVFEQDGTLWHRLRDAVPDPGETLNCHLDVDRRQETARTHTALHLMLHAMFAHPDPQLALAGPVEVRGGGTARIHTSLPYIEPKRLAAWLHQANQWIRDDRPIHRKPLPRDAAPHELRAQPYRPTPRAQRDRSTQTNQRAQRDQRMQTSGSNVRSQPVEASESNVRSQHVEASKSSVRHQLNHSAQHYPGPEHTLETVQIEHVGGFPCDGTHVARTSDVGSIQVRHAHPDRSGGFIVVIEAQPPKR